MAPVEVIPVKSRHDLTRFIRLPSRLHRNDPNWIAPLVMEQRSTLSARQNPFFQHSDVRLWLARSKGTDVGRISAQINHHALALHHEAAGHFGFLAAINEPAVFEALTRTAQSWLRDNGMKKIQGPISLSINEETGLLVDGFDTPPMLLMGHDHPYVGPRLEECGYAKAKDVYAYLYDMAVEVPPSARKLLARPLPADVSLRQLDMRRYDDEIGNITEIFNDAWSENWGFVPLTEAETTHLATSLRPVIDKDLVWFVEVAGEPAAFAICLPNINEAIRDLGGRLWPFGWAKLLWRLKIAGVRTARVPLMGVKRKHATSLAGALMPFLLIDAMRKGASRKGLRTVELGWILEDNLPMRRIIEAMGGVAYKTYRVYEKAL